MASDTQSPPQTRIPSPGSLGSTLVLDLLLISIVIVILAVVIPVIFISIRTFQQGIPLPTPGQLGRSEALRLLGVDGIMTLLITQNILFAGVPLVRTALLRKEPLALIGVQANHPLRLALIGCGLGALVLAGNIVFGLLFVSLGIRQNQSAQYPLVPGDYMGQALFAIGAALLAPLGEEILFRGYVFNTLRRIWPDRIPGTLAAYVVSALLFTIAHGLSASEGLIALLVPVFFMGLVLAWAVRLTGSILPGIIAHSINNGVALLALLVCVNNPGLAGCPSL